LRCYNIYNIIDVNNDQCHILLNLTCCVPVVCIVNKHYMTKHIKTAEHGREMVGCGNIEVAEAVRYKPREKKQPQI